MPFGKTLADVLPAKVHADLQEAAWNVQYPPKMLEPLRPWLAAVYLELYSYIKAGFSSFYGVDHVIEQEAKDREKAEAVAKGATLVCTIKLSRGNVGRMRPSCISDDP